MADLFAARRAFMHAFDMPLPDSPTFRAEQLAMWQTMLAEEWQEFTEALADYRTLADQPPAEQLRRRAELTAEGVDVLNVLVGLLLSQGLPVEAMFNAIHAANLRKQVNGQVVRRADGKILKPDGWLPADKEDVIRAAMADDSALA
ncbi:nucleoside triphosphate pyrophosphohydrolase family protein [Crenobacter sp. SG2303]|uniref:Nucleoside triphosphate pyrophosphohydrolase family protein n=1 Tax=Crenobacter oryzisoli TaxID=3056844 RepID=A0ABT7XRP8_9NEIS|nr:nucleoside triphosphate pyrophosphohydrolase family protein [Crenobacter sp. SG2303]MDN0076462.1 nucleoside triphosphate pyrophosphohydrolase family protein [Crenobacter sp. SG2303]